ncbi:MAG: hypothetical protein CMH98_03755 [Oceanospirillaceae bacterium]|nr:hypothetical protein [Oceanospirillaceae bacterium]
MTSKQQKMTAWRQITPLIKGRQEEVQLIGNAERFSGRESSVFSVSKTDDGQILFDDSWDTDHTLTCTKEEALTAIEELKQWILQDSQGKED